jgi:hypothetical protein
MAREAIKVRLIANAAGAEIHGLNLNRCHRAMHRIALATDASQ